MMQWGVAVQVVGRRFCLKSCSSNVTAQQNIETNGRERVAPPPWEALKKKKKKKQTNDKDQAASSDTSKSASNSDPSSLSSKTITARLRVYGLPVRYFGETHEIRLQWLQEALEKETQMLQGLSEMEEFRLGKGHGIRNQFLERDNDDKPKKNQQQPPKPMKKKLPKQNRKSQNPRMIPKMILPNASTNTWKDC